MTGIFKTNNPSNNFLLFIYGLLLKLPMFLHPVIPVARQSDGFCFRLLLNWLKPIGSSFPIIYPVCTLLLFFTQAIALNRVVSTQRLLQKNCYLAAMAFLLITSLFSEWFSFTATLLINSLLIWIFSELCKLQNNQNPKTILFNIGVVTGIATFFYFPSIAFLLLIIVGLVITRPFKLPEWLMVLLGLLTPYYFMFSWLYLSDRLKDYRLPDFEVTAPTLNGNVWAYLAIVFIFILVLLGIYFIKLNMRRQLVLTRKSWGLLFLYLLVSLFVPFINETNNFDYWILAAIPISVIASATFFYPGRKWVSLISHWGLVVLIIINNYFIK